jgi:hypothetical protein
MAGCWHPAIQESSMHRSVLLHVIFAGSLTACSGQPAAPASHPLAGRWRTSPEDLPYSGPIPNQRQVAINLALSAEGTGHWQPFYALEDMHLPSSDDDGQRFRWREVDGAITFESEDKPASTCRGRASADRLELEVAGCAFLASLVSLPNVAFARQ